MSRTTKQKSGPGTAATDTRTRIVSLGKQTPRITAAVHHRQSETGSGRAPPACFSPVNTGKEQSGTRT